MSVTFASIMPLRSVLRHKSVKGPTTGCGEFNPVRTCGSAMHYFLPGLLRGGLICVRSGGLDNGQFKSS